MSHNKRYISSVKYDVLANLVTKAGYLISSVILARALDIQDFGIVAIALSFNIILSELTGFGLGSGIINSSKTSDMVIRSAFYLNVLTGTVLTIAMVFISPYIATEYDLFHYLDVFLLFTIVIFLTSIVRIPEAIFSKQMNFRLLSRIEILSSVMAILFAIYSALGLKIGIYSLVVLHLSKLLIKTVVIVYLNRWILRFELSIESLKGIWGYSQHLYKIHILYTITNNFEAIFIGKQFNVTTLALYTRAKSTQQMFIHTLLGSVSKVLFPSISQVKDDREKVHKIMRALLLIVSYLIFSFTAILILTAEEVVVFLYSEKWREAHVYLEYVLVSGVLTYIATLLDSAIKGVGESKRLFKIDLIRRGGYVLTIVASSFIGFMEMLLGIVIISAINLVITIIIYSKIMNSSNKQVFLGVFKNLLISICVGVVTHVLSENIMDPAWGELTRIAIITSIYIATILIVSIGVRNSAAYLLLDYFSTLRGGKK